MSPTPDTTLAHDGMVPPHAVDVSPSIRIGAGRLALIGGPCAIESRELALEVADGLAAICGRLELPFVFKASLDKANRTSSGSFRSIGFERSLEILAEVRDRLDVAVLTDVHETWQVGPVAEVVDILQIPAFLCRQTDLLAAAGQTGRVVNVKKGQFLAPEDMRFAVEKAGEAAESRVLLTERGTTFGYRDLVVDFRSLVAMRSFAPVVFDATHSVQSPGGGVGRSAGRREYVAPLARAAVAVGVDALFLETHPRPEEALSDGPNMIPLAEIEDLLADCLALHSARERPA